jgi:hypothetical protein
MAAHRRDRSSFELLQPKGIDGYVNLLASEFVKNLASAKRPPSVRMLRKFISYARSLSGLIGCGRTGICDRPSCTWCVALTSVDRAIASLWINHIVISDIFVLKSESSMERCGTPPMNL